MSGTVEQVDATDCKSTDSGHDQSSLAARLEGDGLSRDAKLAINRALKHRRTSRPKGSIERRSPLRLKPRARTQLDLQEEHLAALLKAKEAASRLPKQSAYARHRLACIEKALSLLNMQRYGPCQRALYQSRESTCRGTASPLPCISRRSLLAHRQCRRVLTGEERLCCRSTAQEQQLALLLEDLNL